MSNIDKALQVLSATNDGRALSPGHLHLVELAVNNHLSPEGQAAFNNVHQAVLDGDYVQPWMHGIEHLRRKQDGTVTWRGIAVEHYTFSDADQERDAAKRLAAHCLSLEARSIPVNTRTATDREMWSCVPRHSSWLPALLSFYTAFADKEGRCAWLIVYQLDGHAFAIRNMDGRSAILRASSGDYDSAVLKLYRVLELAGNASCSNRLRTYEGFVSAMNEAGISPEMIGEVLAGDVLRTAA